MRLEGPAIARDTHFEADVCIVGGGVAGLILADALGDLPLDVIVIESGEPDDVVPGGAVDMAYESSESELEPILGSRARALGGTAVVWNTFLKNRPAARYLRMESVDFEDREGRPHGGWPFGIVELEPYYRAAEPLCMPGFDASAHERASASHGLPVDAARVAAVTEGFGLADQFTERLPRAVLKKSRVKVITGATVAEIRTNERGSRAERVEVKSSAGKGFSVGFRTLVLAAGTIENTRLLLASQGSRPLGIGNDHDVVGRYYMDHQRLNAGHLFPDDPKLFERAVFLDFRAHGSLYFMGKLKLSESLIREQRLLNSSTLFWPRPRAADDRGVDAMKDLARAIKSRRFGAEALGYAGEVARAGRYLVTTGPRLALVQRTRTPNISRGGWSHLKRNRDRFEYFELVQQIEQVPSPDNRVTLGETRDRLGLRLPRISVNWCAEDLESARRSQRLLAEELERCGMGRVVYDGAGFPDLHQTGGIHHHLGSTRMHTDPRWGVVDADCRVHGVDNLFIAGGSVFPTGGYANPTLTIAALTLRLAAHLKATLARVGGP